MKIRTVKLTKSEIGHILTLISVNDREGWYYGNKEQYRKRSERIKYKLLKRIICSQWIFQMEHMFVTN